MGKNTIGCDDDEDYGQVSVDFVTKRLCKPDSIVGVHLRQPSVWLHIRLQISPRPIPL